MNMTLNEKIKKKSAKFIDAMDEPQR